MKPSSSEQHHHGTNDDSTAALNVGSYALTIVALGERPFQVLSDREFEELKTSKQNLLTVLGIEEKFELIIGNYAEYEGELLGLSLRAITDQTFVSTKGMVDMQVFNRRLANLLTATRLYIDQTKHDVKSVFDTPVLEVIKSRFSEEYDTNIAYRVMEALRNYTQHRALPIQGITYALSWDYDLQHRRHGVDPQINIAQLAEEPKFKTAVLRELQARDNGAASVTPLVRSFVESLWRVHSVFREQAREPLDLWKQALNKACELARSRTGRDAGVAAVAINATGDYTETVYLTTSIVDRIDSLVAKNANFANLSRAYISTK